MAESLDEDLDDDLVDLRRLRTLDLEESESDPELDSELLSELESESESESELEDPGDLAYIL